MPGSDEVNETQHQGQSAGKDQVSIETRTGTLSLQDDISVLLVRTANKLTAHSSGLMRSRFGIGAIEWRMLVMLTLESGIPASRAADVVGIDKAAVSRALNGLRTRGLIDAELAPRDPRRKTWSMTEAGRVLHDEVLVWARQRDRDMLAGIDRADQETVKTVLRRMIGFFEQAPADSSKKA